jgi:hypothetical protein
MTTRRWMIAVAVVAVGCAAVLHSHQERRRERFARIADQHLSVDLMPSGFPYRERRSAKRLDWHRKMADKYLHAADYPWLPVEPDPPAPK